MNQLNIGKNIAALRKAVGITQDNLAAALNISPQAVSKWETNTCLPDTQILPMIAAYFNISIDYLFFGKEIVYNDIYDKVQQKTASYPQMNKESYEEAHKLFAAAHHGISHGNLRGSELMYDEPAHISNLNGLSLLSGKGYGAVITRNFFENITEATLHFTHPILKALAQPNTLPIIALIISMNDISIFEIEEKLGLNKEEIQKALNTLIAADLVTEKVSKHKALGKTYTIASMYHTCLCILLATMEMQRDTLKGISCCMGPGDYPIKLAIASKS